MIAVSAPVYLSSRSLRDSIPRNLCLLMGALAHGPSRRLLRALVCFLAVYPTASEGPGCHPACSLDAGWSHWVSAACFREGRCWSHLRRRSTRTSAGRIWVFEILVGNAVAADVSVSFQQHQQESMNAVIVVLSVMGCELLVKRARRAYPTT